MSDAVEKHIEESCKNFLDGQIQGNLRSFLQQTQIKYGVPQHKILRIIRKYLQRNNILFDFRRYLSRSTAQKAYVPVKLSASGAEVFSNSDGTIPSYINCPEKSENVARSWDVFRKLIAYYTSCIEMEDGATAFAFQDQINEVFCYLQKNGKWFPQPGHPWQCCVPLAGDSQIRNLWKSDAGQLVLGYPVYAICKKDGEYFVTTVTPIYYYQLTHKFSARGLELNLIEAKPQVNLHWLDVAFGRNPSARRQFLEACGLSAAQTDEVQEAQPACGVSFSGLASMLTAVALRAVCEPLNPEAVPAELLKPPFANGIYNRAVVMISRKTRYSRTLLAELAGIAALPDSVLERTALKYIFCPEPQKEACVGKRDAAVPEPPVQKPDSEGLLMASGLMNPDAVAEILPFNVRQREAVAALLSAPLTVLQGPPGTGKSQVVAGASACARLSGQSVLISSRNHKAIDAVMGRIEETPGGRLPVIRANSKDDPNLRYSFLKALKDLLSEQVDTEARTKSPDVLKNLRGRLRERAQLGLTARRITTLAEQLGEISEHLVHCETQMGADLLEKIKKIPYAFSRTCAASVDFIARCEREKRSFARAVVSPECFSGLRTLLRLRKFLQKTNSAPGLHFWRRNDAESLSVLKSRLRLVAEWAELKTAEKACEHAAAKLPPLAAVTADFEQCGKRIAAILPEALKFDALRRPGIPPGTDRSNLDMLRAGLLAARTAFAGHALRREAEEKLAEQLPALLDACPVWAVTSLSAGTFIPLLPGMFDTVIIDEASQSDIPSAIPLLFRAKRAAVVGDPCQLPFISTMGAEKDTLLLRNAGLAGLADLRFAYAANSLYDVAAGSPVAVCRMLCETYRSSAEIAAYSNELFYHNALSVCTAEERLHVPSGKKAGIEWTDVVGEIVGAPGGSAFCQAEVDAVVTLVHELLVLGNFSGSLGIVTPFRLQANRIHDALYDSARIPVEMLTRAAVHVDTVHGFQGDERDVMIFSLCAGPGMSPGAEAFLRENGRLFNVAVSRARAVVHVVGNKDWARQSSVRHISLLATLRAVSQRPPVRGQWFPYESPWEKELAEALLSAGLDVKPQFPVRNRRLDLALTLPGTGCRLDIEVDGDCHRNTDGSRKSDDYWRDIQLRSLGWRVQRFWTYQLRKDLPGCVRQVQTVWDEMKRLARQVL